MWKKIRDSVLFLILALVVFLYGAFHIITLVILPHVQNFTSRVSRRA